jgi:hypothetical protein
VVGVRWQSLTDSTDDTAKRYFHWSAAHSFTQDEATIHDALPSLARQAYEEMIADAQKQGIKPGRVPAAMAALAVGSDVYFSSSLRGGMFLLSPGTPDTPNGVKPEVAEELAAAIVRCQYTYTGEHNFGTNCAEPLAIHQWLVNNQQITVTGQGKISTYGRLAGKGGQMGIRDPCVIGDGDGKWGCHIFLDKLQIGRVGKEGDFPDLPSIEPAQALPHCLWSNGA